MNHGELDGKASSKYDRFSFYWRSLYYLMTNLFRYLSTTTFSEPSFFLKMANNICLRNLLRSKNRMPKLNINYFIKMVIMSQTKTELFPFSLDQLLLSKDYDLWYEVHILSFAVLTANWYLIEQLLQKLSTAIFLLFLFYRTCR